MNADEVRAALCGRWPNERYLHIAEAPLNHYRQGSKIDVLVIDQWQSGKHQTEAIEIKVSYNDWCNEWRTTQWIVTDHLGRPRIEHRKPSEWTLRLYTADFNRYRRDDEMVPDGFEPTVERVHVVDVSKNSAWRERAHRFWIAAPTDLALRIRDDCDAHAEMTGWGVLAVAERATQVIRKPTTATPKEWGHSMWLGIVRSAADAGPAALQRARDAGYRDGKAAAEREAEGAA